jgi:hypothetical protein
MRREASIRLNFSSRQIDQRWDSATWTKSLIASRCDLDAYISNLSGDVSAPQLSRSLSRTTVPVIEAGGTLLAIGTRGLGLRGGDLPSAIYWIP